MMLEAISLNSITMITVSSQTIFSLVITMWITESPTLSENNMSNF